MKWVKNLHKAKQFRSLGPIWNGASRGLRFLKDKEKNKLWLNDSSCIRLRSEYKDHVWSYDIIEDKTYNGTKFRIFNIIDKYSRKYSISLASRRIA